jgi:cytochrome c peroxidase
MKPSFAPLAYTILSLVAFPALAQFIEAPTPPPSSLKEVALPEIKDINTGTPFVDEVTPDGANGFIKDEAAAILLGKALFWDMQMGSDEVACATCHYHAGADNRRKNQLSPGLNGGNGVFDFTKNGKIGPNANLVSGSFPFHELANPSDRSSAVTFDTDDVTSSAGTFSASFNDIVEGDAIDNCTPIPDVLGFHINGLNTRQVEPRNTPTIINAAFNDRNFWDGRANNIFNGVDGSGLRNAAARVLEVQGANVVQVEVALQNSSLASQSVVPPIAGFETSCNGRTLAKIGKKLLSVQPLALQNVHPQDSVLGAYRDTPRGLTTSYEAMIKNAISDRFWNSNKLFDAAKNEIGSGAPTNTDQYTLMEANFPLIWGLAIQAFERTQISDDAPFDQWSEQNAADGGQAMPITDGKDILSADEVDGMNLFFTNTVGQRGVCSTCHQGPTFTTVAFPFTEEQESGEFPEIEQRVERMKIGDGFTITENLFRYFVQGEGSVGGVSLAGTAGARNIPSPYPAASGGDFSVNSCQREVYSFMMNQDTMFIGGPFPPPVEVPNTATKDAQFVLRGCGEWLRVTLIDGGFGSDTATIEDIDPIVLPAPQSPPLPIVVNSVVASGPIDGDFKLNNPTLYDTAFYNIGVRPTAEDIGVGATDSFGVPLSFTKQWVNSLLGTPIVDDYFTLTLARLHLPFNYFGDTAFFPGGLTGPEWPVIGFFPCAPFPGANPPGIFGACFIRSEEGKGNEAYPKYPTGFGPGVDALQTQAINDMNTAVDGSFKVPGLRNVTLTGPYFHNGGQATLDQVLEFYNRGGDFGIENLGNLAPNIHPLGLDKDQRNSIVAFLGALTDERVRCKQAPFDHPGITLPEGHQTKDDGSGQAKDKITEIDAVGAGGVSNNKCLAPFLE